jgi:hypothetical protein
MKYSVELGRGKAGLRFDDPLGAPGSVRASLVALLYGRVLCVHEETRAELFLRVGAAAERVLRSEGRAPFGFDLWVMNVGGAQTLWPWEIVEPSELTSATIYSATLKVCSPNPLAPLGRWVHLDMGWGLERVLAPSSALIAIAGLSALADGETRHYLAFLLQRMNGYWGSPQNISLNTEAKAYAAAAMEATGRAHA